MCGICGRINFDNKLIAPDLLHHMCESIRYRGPDSEGLFLRNQHSGFDIKPGPDVGLGIRRLAIIDLKTGDQPIHNENKSVWLVSNGEIYNFKDLRQDLEKKGHRFYTQTDTEVIVHLYEDYGTNCLKYLRGMFALALWDENNKQLFLARDRVGKKPLCYARLPGGFVFASEIKALLENPEIKREIDFSAIDHFLTYNYIPTPLTIFNQIKKMPPASFLLCNARGDVAIESYWDLDYRIKTDLSEKEYSEKILGLLREATRLRLVSDVPLGALLSGGLDSSAIVGLMAQEMTRPVKTFSVGFEESDYSELEYARIVARHFKTEHHEFIVKPKTIEMLPQLVRNYNEPYADSSMLPSYYVAREASRHVTVALNGDGGDENFAGYPRYQAHKIAQFCTAISLGTHKLACGLIDFLPIKNTSGRRNFLRRLKRFAQGLKQRPEVRNLRWHTQFDDELKQDLYTTGFSAKVGMNRPDKFLVDFFQKAPASNLVDRILYTDVKTYLPEDLLVKMDIATMANSLEGRSPFLDHHFMEFTAQIPARLKLKGLTMKYMLKKALNGFLPEPILRRGKMGFGLPVSEWFRGKLGNYLKEILLADRAIKRGYFKQTSLERIINDHISGRSEHGYRLWGLLVLELWHRIFIEKESP